MAVPGGGSRVVASQAADQGRARFPVADLGFKRAQPSSSRAAPPPGRACRRRRPPAAAPCLLLSPSLLCGPRASLARLAGRAFSCRPGPKNGPAGRAWALGQARRPAGHGPGGPRAMPARHPPGRAWHGPVPCRAGPARWTSMNDNRMRTQEPCFWTNQTIEKQHNKNLIWIFAPGPGDFTSSR